MKKVIIAILAVFLSAGCAGGSTADSSPALRVQDGQLQYQDESGNWNAVANKDTVEEALKASAETSSDSSEPVNTPEVKESSSSEQKTSSVTVTQGPKGEKGDKGDKGEKGDTGPAGQAGKDGANGTAVTIGADGELILNGNPTGYLLTKKPGAGNLLETPKITKVKQDEHSTGVLVTWKRIKNAGSYTISCEEMQYTTTDIYAAFDDLSVGDHVIYITANPISGRNDYSTSLTGESSFTVKQSSLVTPNTSWDYSNPNYQNMTAALDLEIDIYGGNTGKVKSYKIYLDGGLLAESVDRNYHIDSIDASREHEIRVVAIPSDVSKYTSSEYTFTVYRYYFPTPEPTPTPTPVPTPTPTWESTPTPTARPTSEPSFMPAPENTPSSDQATVPTINSALYDGMKGSEIISHLTETMNAAGFYNLKFVKIPTDSTKGVNALKSVSPVPGSVINVKDQITIEYYSAD